MNESSESSGAGVGITGGKRGDDGIGGSLVLWEGKVAMSAKEATALLNFGRSVSSS